MMKEENKEVMEKDKLDFKSEIILKISLAILAYKALAFNLILFTLLVFIPLLNPDHFDYKK